MDEKNSRLSQVIDYLRDNRAIRNQQELAEMMNYDRSTLSMCKNGKLAVPNSLFIKLNEVFPTISLEWLLYGLGKMTTDTPLKSRSMVNNPDGVTIPTDAWNVIKQQAASLEAKDRQIDRLIDAITSQLNATNTDTKKTRTA